MPRLYEVMRQRILNGISRQTGLKPKLFAKAVDLGSRSYEDPRSLSFGERLLNPLPLFHVNSGIVSILGMMLTGNCQIQPERFSPDKWWPSPERRARSATEPLRTSSDHDGSDASHGP